jgi:hypothetical protein
MVRPKAWWAYNLGLGHEGGAEAAVGKRALDQAPEVRKWLEAKGNFLGGNSGSSIYPIRDAIDLGLTVS